MAFQGSLKELPLPDIIQLVSVSGKTGKFTLSHDAERGYIFLRGGQMVHAEVGDLLGEEAIYSLALWNQGDFQFTPGEEPPRQSITKSNTNLLMEAARRSDEWRVLSKKIPSIELVPELKIRENRHEQITLNPQEWLLVTRVDGRRSVAEIGKALNISPFDVAKVLYGLITSELVALKKKVDEPPVPSASGGVGISAEQRQHLIMVATKIRTVAEEYLGTSGHKSVEKAFRTAMDEIDGGAGFPAIQTMVSEFEKTTALLRGVAVTEQFRVRVGEIS